MTDSVINTFACGYVSFVGITCHLTSGCEFVVVFGIAPWMSYVGERVTTSVTVEYSDIGVGDGLVTVTC